MIEAHFLVPVTDNAGQPFPPEPSKKFANRLTALFNGMTGPTPPAAHARVRAVVGGSQGVSLSVRLSGGEELVKDEEGYQFPSEWTEAIVRTTATTTKGKSVRVFVIKPGGPDVQEIRVGERFIQGPFTIVNKINNPREANDAWKAAARAK